MYSRSAAKIYSHHDATITHIRHSSDYLHTCYLRQCWNRPLTHLAEWSGLGIAMDTLEEAPGSSHSIRSELMCVPGRCRACIMLKDRKRNETGQVFDKRRSMRFGFTPRTGTVRQVYSTPHLRDSFIHKLRHLRRGKNLEGDGGSLRCLCEAATAAQSATPDHSVHGRALRVVSCIINLGRQPETSGHENLSRGGAPDNSEATSDDDVAHERGLAHQDGGVGVVSNRRLETAVAHRRSAPTPKESAKRRTTYIVPGNFATSKNEFVEQHNMNDNMAPELEATMMDLRSDLEWLDPGTSLQRDFSVRNRASHGEDIRNLRDTTFSVQEEFERDAFVTSPDLRYNQDMEGLQALDSLPELDREYQSSDSGHSNSDELVAKHLTPAESMRELLPKDMAGRFGSFYSVSNGAKEPGLNILPDEMDWTYSLSRAQVSRFSWGSSVYSDAGEDSVEPNHVWWKPRPLVVNKETRTAPPIPERNPLRLMQRLSNGFPKSFGENMRRSRNIYNLHLDLATSNKSSKTNSWRTSNSSKKRSQVQSSKQTPKLDSGVALQPSSALPGHILDAMRSTPESTEATRRPRDRKKGRRSGRTSEKSTKHASTGNADRHAKQPIEARGHFRSKSEPFPASGPNRNVPSKWNESMPSEGCIRRSCITGLANEVRPRRSVPNFAINKQLPPLPVTMES